MVGLRSEAEIKKDLNLMLAIKSCKQILAMIPDLEIDKKENDLLMELENPK